MTTPDPWAIGTPITETHPLHAMLMAWDSVEKTLEEWGIPQAEPRAKAILARLAALEPPVLPVHPHEMRDEDAEPLEWRRAEPQEGETGWWAVYEPDGLISVEWVADVPHWYPRPVAWWLRLPNPPS